MSLSLSFRTLILANTRKETSKYFGSSSTRFFSSNNDDDDGYFQRILQRFPGGRCLSFAYGSGVFQQDGQKRARDNMTDLILAVDDPATWHKHNLLFNPKDYSGLMRTLGPKVISDVQDKWGARMYFNTLIPFEEGKIKYGVISRNAFIGDLLDWESLYVAGRLHKPVKILDKSSSDKEIDLALRMNLKSALHTALLLLPATFNEINLFMAIARISYTGDFRMSVGEDKNKVQNLVKPLVTQFSSLYMAEIENMSEFVVFNRLDKTFTQDISPNVRHFHLALLPKNLQIFLLREWSRDRKWRDIEDVLRAASFDSDLDELISRSLSFIVGPTSISQAAKGIFSAGPLKSSQYAGAKFAKMIKSLNK